MSKLKGLRMPIGHYQMERLRIEIKETFCMMDSGICTSIDTKVTPETIINFLHRVNIAYDKVLQ